MDKKTKDAIDEIARQVNAMAEEKRVNEKVTAIVKLRCASAYASILGFISLVGGVAATFSDTLRAAGKAALKVIIARIMS